MTDSDIIKAVLESKGWKFTPARYDEEVGGFCLESSHWSNQSGDKQAQPLLLTSRDACWETFEKDAPDGYWWHLKEMFKKDITLIGDDVAETYEYGTVATLKATPRQRCESWLRLNNLWKD